MKKIINSLLIAIFASQLIACFQPIELPKGLTPSSEFTISDDYLSDGAIFQQKSNLVIQGMSEEGAVIIATLYNHKDAIVEQSYALTLSSGNYRIDLQTPSASFNKYYLVIDDSVHQRTIADLRFGHVWLLAGENYLNIPISTFASDENTNNNIAFFHHNEEKGQWFYQADAEYEQNVSEFAHCFAQLLSERLSSPVGIILSQVDASHLDAWLNPDYVESRPRARDFVDLNNRYHEEVFGSVDDYDQMSYLFETKIKPFSNLSLTGLLWYQGFTDLNEVLNKTNAEKEEYFSLYNINLTYVMQAMHAELGNDLKIYLLQELSYPEELFPSSDLVLLREAQALGSYFYTYTNIITTYDLIYQVDKEDWQALIAQLAERIYLSVRTNTYFERINYSATSYTNIIITPQEIRIKFSSKLNNIKAFEGLVILNQNDEVLELDISIDDVFLVIDLSNLAENEQIDMIVYAWLGDISACNLRSSNNIPVVPFKIDDLA